MAANAALALDRGLVERLPASADKVALRQYLTDVANTTLLERHEFMNGSPYLGYGFSDGQPPYVLKSSEIKLKNWKIGKCEEVQQKIKDARGLFAEFKTVATELAEILERDVVDPDTNPQVESLYQRMESLRQQILAAYPEIYDSWEITVGMKWEFPKKRVFVHKGMGPIFSLKAIATPHVQWSSSDAKRKIPSFLTWHVAEPTDLYIFVKTVPAEFCASPFRFQGYGAVVGNQMDTIHIHLVTNRDVQFF